MARVASLGDLDWRFEPPCAKPLDGGPLISQLPDQHISGDERLLRRIQVAGSPVILDTQERVLHLAFLLRLEEAISGPSEVGGYNRESGWWGFLEGANSLCLYPGRELTLPPSIRVVLEKLYGHLQALLIFYEWNGSQELRIDICFPEESSPLRIIFFSRFLESLASRMGKWYGR